MSRKCKPCNFDGKRYESIADLARSYGIFGVTDIAGLRPIVDDPVKLKRRISTLISKGKAERHNKRFDWKPDIDNEILKKAEVIMDAVPSLSNRDLLRENIQFIDYCCKHKLKGSDLKRGKKTIALLKSQRV